MRRAPALIAKLQKLRSMTEIIPLAEIPDAWIEELLDRAFGTDRQKRTAYKVRAGMEALGALSFAAVDNDRHLAGTIQCWPVMLTEKDGTTHPMIMVGPVAVLPEKQSEGMGRELMKATLDALAANESLPLVMIGDADYYDRFFGFSALHTAGWDLPGPFEKHRLLARVADGVVLPRTGTVGPWKRKL